MTCQLLTTRRCVPIVLTLFLLSSTAIAGEKSASLAKFIPADAIAYGELAGLDKVLQRIQHSQTLELVTASPQFQQAQKSPQYRMAQAVRQIAETQLGMDLWTAGKKLLGGRVAVAVYPKPDSNEPDAVVLVQAADKAAYAQFRQRLEPFLVLLEGQIDSTETIEGTKVLGIQGRAFVALRDDGIAAASTRTLMTKALQLLGGKAAGSLADDEAFQTMNRQMGGEHLLQAYVNTGAIAKASGGRFAPEKVDNALASLLFSGIVELAVRSPYAGLTLDVTDNNFVLKTGVAGGPQSLGETHQAFFSDPAGPGTPRIPQPRNLIGGFTIHRDFSQWYRHREKLIQEQSLPGFDKFEAGLGNLLPGKDFGEDVLPLLGKDLTFVAAPQDYSYLKGKPGVQLPGFGLIVALAKPEEGAKVIQLFFQTLSAILNIQAGQQGREPWVMNSETYKDVQISYGQYLEKPSGDRLPIVFNFMPAAARVGDNYVITSSRGLCRQLIDDLKKPHDDAKRPNRNLNFEFHLGPFADILRANQNFFQARLVQQGRNAKRAKTELDMLYRWLGSFNSLRFSTNVKSDAFQVQLEGSWK